MFSSVYKMYKIILIQFLLITLSIAKFPPNLTATFFSTNNNEIDEKEDTCKLSVLPPNPESMCCGVDLSSSNNIMGGAPTGINQYPWLAVIKYKFRKSGNIGFACGGSLISGLYVLTAGHCVTGKVLNVSEPYSVVLGDYDKYHDGPDCVKMRGREICSDGETTIKIAKTIPHPLYRPESKSKKVHDIALIRLASMAPYTDAIRPICLPSFDINAYPQNSFQLLVAGWGIMKQVNESNVFKSTTSAVKRHVQIPFVNNKKCQPIFPHVTTNQVCAGGLKNEGACRGDSGGPLMFSNEGQFQSIGVVSYGDGRPCAQLLIPSVYTNVFKYKEWIFNVIDKGMHETKFGSISDDIFQNRSKQFEQRRPENLVMSGYTAKGYDSVPARGNNMNFVSNVCLFFYLCTFITNQYII